MISSVEEYLKSLKEHLTGSDPALIQDALSDAEEYLRNALSQSPGSESDTLNSIINKFGSPEEVAAGYLAMGKSPLPAPAVAAAARNRSALSRFFGVFRDMKAWGALIYMLLAMFTGIVYFTWVVTGVSLSAGLIVLIVGLPILALFLLSVRLESFLEGRIVETLLGTRMPRRPRFFGQNKGLWQKIKSLFAERTTWTGIVYGIMQLPLGITYFTVVVILIALSLSAILWPFSGLILHTPAYFIVGDTRFQAANPVIPFLSIPVGIVLLALTMHLSKAVGRFHGAWAKVMLVSKND